MTTRLIALPSGAAIHALIEHIHSSGKIICALFVALSQLFHTIPQSPFKWYIISPSLDHAFTLNLEPFRPTSLRTSLLPSGLMSGILVAMSEEVAPFLHNQNPFVSLLSPTGYRTTMSTDHIACTNLLQSANPHPFCTATLLKYLKHLKH